MVLASSREENIVIQHYHEGFWEQLKTEVDLARFTATVKMDSLSIFVLTVKVPEPTAAPAPTVTATTIATGTPISVPTVTVVSTAIPTHTPAQTPTAAPTLTTTPIPVPTTTSIPVAGLLPTATNAPTRTELPDVGGFGIGMPEKIFGIIDTPEDTDVWTFSAEAGQRITVLMDRIGSGEFIPLIEIFGASGDILGRLAGEIKATGVVRAGIIGLRIPESGTITIHSSGAKNTIGQYSLELTADQDGPITISPQVGNRGSRGFLTGRGFPPSSSIDSLTVGGVSTGLLSENTDTLGNISVSFTVPTSTPFGVQQVEIIIGGTVGRVNFGVSRPLPTPLPRPTSTRLPTAVPAPLPTAIAISAPTAVLQPTLTPTPVPTPTETPIPTAVPTPTPLPIPTPQATVTPVSTATPTPIATLVPTPSTTPNPTPTPTTAPTPTPPPTSTPIATATPTPSPTVTPTLVPTSTPQTDVPQSSPFTVTKTGDNNDGVCGSDCSLREAIAAAGSGDTVNIPAGTYTLTSGSELTISISLTLSGAGASSTIIQAASTPGVAGFRVFNIADGNAVLSGMTIRHGHKTGPAADAAGIFVNSGASLTISNSTITQNKGGACRFRWRYMEHRTIDIDWHSNYGQQQRICWRDTNRYYRNYYE